jgi:hypothetical protein
VNPVRVSDQDAPDAVRLTQVQVSGGGGDPLAPAPLLQLSSFPISPLPDAATLSRPQAEADLSQLECRMFN